MYHMNTTLSFYYYETNILCLKNSIIFNAELISYDIFYVIATIKFKRVSYFTSIKSLFNLISIQFLTLLFAYNGNLSFILLHSCYINCWIERRKTLIIRWDYNAAIILWEPNFILRRCLAWPIMKELQIWLKNKTRNWWIIFSFIWENIW